MTALIDLDSLIYSSVYRIVSFSQMREALSLYGKESAKQWVLEEVYNEGINRLENELLRTQSHLQSIFKKDITSFELYITTCSKSFRKELSKSYKSKRKPNKYVTLIREHYRHNGAFSSETLEADDLIANRAYELGIDNCIVVSIDKDLKQIGGYYWSYYKQNSRDMYGNLVCNDYGIVEKEYKQKQVEFIDKEQAYLFFYSQMLIGDSVDNISGITKVTKELKNDIKKETGKTIFCSVGKVSAEKIMSNSKNHFITVAREYIIRNQKGAFWLNYKLLKLGH